MSDGPPAEQRAVSVTGWGDGVWGVTAGGPIIPSPLPLQTHALGAHLNCLPGPQRVWLLKATLRSWSYLGTEGQHVHVHK